MNILPKKRWHVRTKENIARVRKDEAEAAEKERQEQLRIENADREARLNVLKHKSKQRLLESGIIKTTSDETEITTETVTTASGHINLFEDLDHAVTTTNKDHDKEVKDKKEEYEKKIGYLTYLGQDTNEALKKKNWYEVLPDASRFSRSADIKDTYDKLVLRDEEGKLKTKNQDVKEGEIAWKAKQRHDPIIAFKKYCHGKVQLKSDSTKSKDDYTQITDGANYQHKSNKKKHRKDKEVKEKKLQKLREARLKRERQEKHKTELFLTGLNEPAKSVEEESVNKVRAKYNSQFNPELARQNYR